MSSIPQHRRALVGVGDVCKAALLALVVVCASTAALILTPRLGASAGASSGVAQGLASSAGDTATVQIRAAADAYVARNQPRSNFGRAMTLIASNSPAWGKISYLRFNIAALPKGSALVSASLLLTRDSRHLSGRIAVDSVSSRWTETGVTRTAAPATSRHLATVVTSPTANTVSTDVLSAVRGHSSIDLAVSSSLTTSSVRFGSRESSTPPVLRLTLRGGDGTGGPTAKPPGGAPSQAKCSVSAKLVPSCGRWWGVAPRAFTTIPHAQALAQTEQYAARAYDIFHSYHRDSEQFPTATERAIALAPGHERLLLLNWKPATDMTWADVAAGRADQRLKAEAAYIHATFPHPFFLNVWHEPENDVSARAGSGMTAADYAAMYRHVVLTLRHNGADRIVTVMNYMGYVPWASSSWFSQLWPGDDVVDWIGLDPYGSADSGGYRAHDFPTLVNRKGGSFAGYYTWATTTHPTKPVMIAEWGVYESAKSPGGKASFYRTVGQQISHYPQIKALVYFDMPVPPDTKGGNTSPESSDSSLAAYRSLGHDPAFVGPKVDYGSL